jgi:hypothetical protein
MTKLLGGLLLVASVRVLVPSASPDARSVVLLQAKGEKDKQKRLSDAQVRSILIEESIAAYPGNCPCPYSTARNGTRCGRRSAYSREGGAEPLCYPKDVSDSMVKEYRDAHADE